MKRRAIQRCEDVSGCEAIVGSSVGIILIQRGLDLRWVSFRITSTVAALVKGEGRRAGLDTAWLLAGLALNIVRCSENKCSVFDVRNSCSDLNTV